MAERGIVKWFKDGYGRVSRADGSEAFLPPRTFPRGEDIAKGDELEFDAEPDPARSGQFLAKNVRTVNKVPRTTPAPAPALPTTAPPRPTASPPLGGLSVWISWSEITEIGGKKFLPVKVSVKQSGATVPDKAVELLKNDRKASKPSVVNSKENGLALFLVSVDNTEQTFKLTAKVGAGVYVEIWDRNKATNATPSMETSTTETKVATRIEVEKSDPDANGVYIFTIDHLPNKRIDIGGDVAVLYRKKGQGKWLSRPCTTDGSGCLELEVIVKDRGASGEIYFRSEDGLRSDNRYVRAYSAEVEE